MNLRRPLFIHSDVVHHQGAGISRNRYCICRNNLETFGSFKTKKRDAGILKKNFINKSFKHKLRATYTLLMFVVLILICAFMYYQVGNIVKPLISHISLQVVEGEAQYLGERFDNQGKLLEQLASTETFKNGEFSSIKKEIDNQMKRHNDLWLSMKYRLVTGRTDR